MYAQVEKSRENKSRAVANSVAQKKSGGKQGFGFVDNRADAVAQRKIISLINNNSVVVQRTVHAELNGCNGYTNAKYITGAGVNAGWYQYGRANQIMTDDFQTNHAGNMNYTTQQPNNTAYANNLVGTTNAVNSQVDLNTRGALEITEDEEFSNANALLGRVINADEVWHHSYAPRWMVCMNRVIHSHFNHTGGASAWGVRGTLGGFIDRRSDEEIYADIDSTSESEFESMSEWSESDESMEEWSGED